MRNVLVICLVALLAIASGCTQKSETAKVESESQTTVKAEAKLTPEELGELGAKIKETPDRARDLLSEHGLTEQTFEAEIRKITEDPDASKRYAAAYKKATSA